MFAHDVTMKLFINRIIVQSAEYHFCGKVGEMGMKKDYIVDLTEEEADELMDEHWVGELVRCKDCRSEIIGEDPDCFVCNNPISPCYQREVSENDYCRHGKEGEPE